jgi:hypothetical protein
LNWSMVSAVSAAFMALVILTTAILAVLQLREVSRARKATAFADISQFLQREEIRKARGILIGIPKKDFKNWTNKEIEAAEKACHTYDVAGIMVFKKLIEPDLIAAEWRHSIIKCWEAAEPMITEYRKERGEDLWDAFELLYKQAKAIEMPNEHHGKNSNV